jgi:NhaA family Na+:H+ antiporter
MIAPAGVYLAVQSGGDAVRGWGIPMATDIAFVVGCMAVLGPRIPHGLRVLLLSLAIVDDIGAILVIAFGYTDKVHVDFLIYGFALIVVLWFFQRWGVRRIPIYVVLGTLIWFCFHESGIHATIAGVILGLLTPADRWVEGGLFTKILKSADNVFSGDWSGSESEQVAAIRHLRTASEEAVSPLERLETGLHPWVGFVIMPVFALANAGIPLNMSELGAPISIAIIAGLVLGKPIGIVAASWLVLKAGLSDMPKGVNWGMLTGGGFLAGIGFTMAIFIAELAFKGDSLDASLVTAKLGILAASLLAAVVGMAFLLATSKSPDGE